MDMNTDIPSAGMRRLLDLYASWSGEPPAGAERLQASGSNREYCRITGHDGTSVIGAVGTSREENSAFIYLSGHFHGKGLPVPRVLAVSADGMAYLQDDLGSVSLFDALSRGRNAGGAYDARERELLARAVRELPRLQVVGARGMDWSNCHPQPEFDIDGALFDLNYFKYCFLKPTGLDFHEARLEADFRSFARDLASEDTGSFMYRDFQARNVMLDSSGNPYFIDFQGGRRGPWYYDLASFLWQASARYPHKLRRDMVYEYYHSLARYAEVPPVRHFVGRLCLFVLFRTLQVLGAYGYRGHFERKRHFLDSIPPAIGNLREMLLLDAYPYPYLVGMLRRMAALDMFAPGEGSPGTRAGAVGNSAVGGKGGLVVRVFSFSYRKGIPEDASGNGGGYVFDCRSTNNPGRYERYRHLTGLDGPVIRFLEEDGGMRDFLESVYRLAEAHVARYIERGFTDLMFSFGCTGGQHRSVYAAERLARRLNERFGIEVRIVHRERNVSEVLGAREQGGACKWM